MAYGAWPEAFEMPGKAIWRLWKCNKPVGRPGLRPGPSWGSLQHSPRPSSWGRAGCPSPTTLSPLSAFQASPLPAPNCQTPSEVKSNIRPWSYNKPYYICQTKACNCKTWTTLVQTADLIIVIMCTYKIEIQNGQYDIPRGVIVGRFRTFSVAGPRAWNQLLISLRQMDCFETIKRHLKAKLFMDSCCVSE